MESNEVVLNMTNLDVQVNPYQGTNGMSPRRPGMTENIGLPQQAGPSPEGTMPDGEVCSRCLSLHYRTNAVTLLEIRRLELYDDVDRGVGH